MKASYIELFKRGGLKDRINLSYDILKSCTLCPRQCNVNRLKGERGFCKTALLPIISSYGPHFGEESPLVGSFGSGTIFFTNCSLQCIFCQNYDISNEGKGYEISIEALAKIMLFLQSSGSHNINFVTPTHVVPQILDALSLAIEQGLSIPLVYNTSGYDTVETIKLLNGIFDIYMPDFKFSSSTAAKQYASAPDYFERASAAILEMYNQVGDLKVNPENIAYKGLLIRHLVMPKNMAGTEEIMRFISDKLSKNTYINIMNQYRPCGEAGKYPDINRRISTIEYKNAIEIAQKYGLYRLDDRTGIPLNW